MFEIKGIINTAMCYATVAEEELSNRFGECVTTISLRMQKSESCLISMPEIRASKQRRSIRVKAWKRSKIDFQPYVYYNNSQGVFVAMICLSKVLAAYNAHT